MCKMQNKNFCAVLFVWKFVFIALTCQEIDWLSYKISGNICSIFFKSMYTTLQELWERILSVFD